VELAPSTVQLWFKPLSPPPPPPGSRKLVTPVVASTQTQTAVAAAIVNFGVFDGQVFNATFAASEVGLPIGCSYTARDLFERKDLGTFDDVFHALVPATSILMLKLTVLHA
jgi:hypothetical protein